MSQSSLSSVRRIDAICGQFEAEWRSGQRPSIEAIVADGRPAERTRLLGELVALEVELRASEGQTPRLQDYLARFPSDEATVLAVFAEFSRAAPTAQGEPLAAKSVALPATERYVLGEQLGRGSMGVVVGAHDRQLDRELAMKLLAEPFQSRRESRERFLREARVCARLQHPGIIPVHEVGWLDQRPYIAMKRVNGQCLDEVLKARAHPAHDLPRFLEVLVRVCETVAYAHAQGIVHRDLKPANVMLGPFGEVYVIDWGLAKVMPEVRDVKDQAGERSEDIGASASGTDRSNHVHADGTASNPATASSSSTWTLLGDVVGTPAYMSPEQACGDTEVVDRRSDVFTLGAILCEVLTGSPPYSGGDRATQLSRAQRGDLADATARLEDCPADSELRHLVCDCLAIAPTDRPPDADHVLRRLTGFLRDAQEKLRKIELDRIDAESRAQERRHRQRAIKTLTASLTLLTLLLVTGTIWFVQSASLHRREETARRQHVHRQLTDTLDELAQLHAGSPVDGRNDRDRRMKVRALARRAETLAESPLADAAHVWRVSEVRARLVAEDADNRLLDSLEEIRLTRAEANPRTNRLDSARTRPLYRKSFADFGLDEGTVDVKQAVAKIRSRPAHVVEACVFGLESWRSLLRNRAAPSVWIDAVLDGIDDDGWRRGMRQACREKNWVTVRELLEADRTKPLSIDAINVVCMKLMDAAQFELALKLLTVAHSKHPGDFWINEYLGVVFYSLPDRRLDESIRFFTAALAIQESGAAYSNLGSAFLESRRYSEAEQAFRAALRLKPDYAYAHLYLAETLKELNRFEEALASIEEAVLTVPDLPRSALIRGELLALIGKRSEALELLRHAIAQDAKSVDARMALGKVLADDGSWAEAAECFRRVIELDPTHGDANRRLRDLLLRLDGMRPHQE